MSESETLPTVPPTSYPRLYEGPIAHFADSHLQESITAAVAGLEPDKHLAVVGFADTKGNQRLAAVTRIGAHWSAVGVLEHTPSGEWSGEAAVRWSI